MAGSSWIFEWLRQFKWGNSETVVGFFFLDNIFCVVFIEVVVMGRAGVNWYTL